MALSQSHIKHIKSLEIKKFRDQFREFIMEGERSVDLVLHSKFLQVKQLIATQSWIDRYQDPKRLKNTELFIISEKELERISFLKTPNEVLALVEIPENPKISKISPNTLTLMLDNISNPGNMGTIIRLADWFGVDTIFCTESSVDIYNPKVVQATMGSIGNIPIIYTDLISLLETKDPSIPVYGALLEGENIYKTSHTEHGVLIIGNEANGISKELIKFIDHQVMIPNFNPDPTTSAESLNAAMATAILLSEFKRMSV